MPAKRRGEADARALLRKFGRALDSDDSPTRVRRPGGSGLAAVRSAVAATQLVGAVALVVVDTADRTAARPEPPGRRTRVGLSSLSRALPNFRRRARASASPRRLAGILSGALLPRAQFRF